MWETGIKLWMRGPGSLESSRGNMCDREGGRWRLHGHGDGSIIWLPLGSIATVYVLAEKAADGMMSCKGVVVVCVSFWF